MARLCGGEFVGHSLDRMLVNKTTGVSDIASTPRNAFASSSPLRLSNSNDVMTKFGFKDTFNLNASSG